jgi:type IV secretory pathway VirJ component
MKTLLLSLMLGAALAPAAAQETVSHGRFKDVRLYRPKGEVKTVALLFSGANGWGAAGPGAAAQVLLDTGAVVAAIDTPSLLANFNQDGGGCVVPEGDVENLSRFLQGYARLPAYFPPLAVGVGSGGALAYAMAAQAPEGTFSGAVSIGFCPSLPLTKPLCKGEGSVFRVNKDKSALTLLPDTAMRTPWLALQGAQDRSCPVAATQAFVAKVPSSHWVGVPGVGEDLLGTAAGLSAYEVSYRRMATEVSTSRLSAEAGAEVGDLPLVEVPSSVASDTLAVLVSGDGGWAGLDKRVAAVMAARGVPVVGWDSLRYFWSARTPQGFADDLARAIRAYTRQWKRSRVVLIGYSQGADVLPFAVNRLPAATRAMVSQTVLLGPGERASFEFKLTNWVSRDAKGAPVAPELAGFTAASATCIYGTDDRDTICPKLPAEQMTTVPLKGDHHFGGNYDGLAEQILLRSR